MNCSDSADSDLELEEPIDGVCVECGNWAPKLYTLSRPVSCCAEQMLMTHDGYPAEFCETCLAKFEKNPPRVGLRM